MLAAAGSALVSARTSARSLTIASSQSSGVAVNPECLEKFQELKLGKKIKYIIFALNSTNTEIVVQKTSDSHSYDDFIAELPEAECRWAIYDFEYEKEGAGKRNKLCFVSWCVFCIPGDRDLTAPHRSQVSRRV